MQKWWLVLSLTLVCYWAESSPVGLGTLEFDNLDTDLDSLSYEVEEEDLDDFSKLLDEEAAAKEAKANEQNKSVKTSGFKKKNTANKGLKSKHNIQDLKKFYKSAGVHDQGAYDDDDVYAAVEGVAAQAVGIKGNEDRTYRKGTKTRGFHRVHHKDEYKKDKAFYEDDETKGTIKKVGAKGLGYKIGAGAGFNKGHFHHNRQKGIYGKQGFLDKKLLDKEFKGYSDAQGFDGSFSSDN
ncbi:uncharacterized protein LOC126379763 [Pectinophora gossypiella]|uniref:uncharacterized protein LOC126379763 n=1 Tax=Pectinophora gossypiella TaxID=13191 RepID=UPI00214E46C5|nr:uncharacterized protein LOC126379763 [Pectinophora gossypiella]